MPYRTEPVPSPGWSPPASMSPRSAKPPLGIYLHWPFCQAICPYCDFNVHLMRDVNAAQWLTAYRRELAYAKQCRPDGPVQTVFFGGGTPSLMPVASVAALLEEIDRLWGFATNVEISLEANPVSAPEAHLQDLRLAGVTRLSLGVQAFDDAALTFLGRTHNAGDARRAFLAAQEIFPHASFDLIYARPGQQIESWRTELQAALALAPKHMSLYQLSIEPATPFAKLQASGKLSLPDEEIAATMYELTQDLCAAAGLPAYEISNHAASGHACRHNLASWQGGDYLGIGPGAHGRLSHHTGRFATLAARQPADWLARVAQHGHGWVDYQQLNANQQAIEAVLLGLRLSAGVSLAALAARGVALEAARLDAARADGLLSDDTDRLQASRQGRLLLDYLTGRLLDDRTRP